MARRLNGSASSDVAAEEGEEEGGGEAEADGEGGAEEAEPDMGCTAGEEERAECTEAMVREGVSGGGSRQCEEHRLTRFF